MALPSACMQANLICGHKLGLESREARRILSGLKIGKLALVLHLRLVVVDISRLERGSRGVEGKAGQLSGFSSR